MEDINILKTHLEKEGEKGKAAIDVIEYQAGIIIEYERELGGLLECLMINELDISQFKPVEIMDKQAVINHWRESINAECNTEEYLSRMEKYAIEKMIAEIDVVNVKTISLHDIIDYMQKLNRQSQSAVSHNK